MPRPNLGAVTTGFRVLPENLASLDDYAAKHGLPDKAKALNHMIAAWRAGEAGEETITVPAAEYERLIRRQVLVEQLDGALAEIGRAATRIRRSAAKR